MRDNRHRAWNSKKKEMLIQGTSIEENRALFWQKWEATPAQHISDPMQFTGKKGSKLTETFPEGQELWECDICMINYGRYDLEPEGLTRMAVIRYDTNEAMYFYAVVDSKFRLKLSEPHESFVVGNIHSDPHLLIKPTS